MQAKQNKQFIHYVPSSAKQGSIHAQWLLGKTNAITSDVPPPSSFSPQSLLLEHDAIRHGTSPWSAGVSCPGCVPSQLLVHPQPAHWQSGGRSSKGLDAMQAPFSSNWNIPVLPTLFPAQIQNTAPYQLQGRKLTLSQPKQVQADTPWAC